MKDIIFVHGMFQNSKSWTNWVNYFTEKGYNCVAPSWPLHEGEPSDLRENLPAGLGELSVDDVIGAMELEVMKYDKPIVIGHSVGGLIAQLMVSRDLVSAGVAISPVAPNKMIDFDWGFLKNGTAIMNPLKGDEPFMMDDKTFNAAFANTLDPDSSEEAYQKYATHDSRNVLRGCMTDSGTIDPDLEHAPLLLIAGEKDEIIPNTLVEKNAKAYTDESSVVTFKEFPNRSHYICGEPGWEEVAAYVSSWLETNDSRSVETEENKRFYN